MINVSTRKVENVIEFDGMLTLCLEDDQYQKLLSFLVKPPKEEVEEPFYINEDQVKKPLSEEEDGIGQL